MTPKAQSNSFSPRDDVRIGIDKGKLRLQFSRRISQEIFGQKQKYFYLGLSDTPDNRLTAERIAGRIQQDIRANKLEKNLELYSPVSELKQQIGIAYDPHRIELSTMELFELFCEFIKPTIAETTFEHQYDGCFRSALSKGPQDLNRQGELVDFLYSYFAAHNFTRSCNALHRMLEWAKKRDLIPAGAPNRFKELKADYPVVFRRRQPPDMITGLIPNYHKDVDYRGFTTQEAGVVMRAFRSHRDALRSGRSNRLLSNEQRHIRYNVCDFVHFCFWTGCRPCEASGLRWLDVAENFEFVFFRHAYSTKKSILKALKTEHVGEEGTKPRKFPCGEKLAALLEKRKNLFYRGEPTDFVFPYVVAEPTIPLNTHHIRYHWYGCENQQLLQTGQSLKKQFLGVVSQLILDGLITQYLTPYATRHTWITLQMVAGVPIKNIAKLAGNSPEIILKNYASYVPNFSLAPEL